MASTVENRVGSEVKVLKSYLGGKWQAGERPRIVAMTANAMDGDRELCLEAGMDDYVTKPIRVVQLVEALGRVQARRRH